VRFRTGGADINQSEEDPVALRPLGSIQEDPTLKSLITLLFLAAGAFAQVSIGIQIGPPPPPRVVRVQPARPGTDFIWVEGYWHPVGNHYKWHNGYWTRPRLWGRPLGRSAL
jgi:hypothetical protein